MTGEVSGRVSEVQSAPEPETPLPWLVVKRPYPSGPQRMRIRSTVGHEYTLASTWTEADAAYIVHAANAYPKLVRAARLLAVTATEPPEYSEIARSLLADLGELGAVLPEKETT